MKIKARVNLCFFVVVLIAALVGVVGFVGQKKSQNNLNELVDEDVRSSILELKVSNLMLQLRRYEKDFFLNIGDRKKQDEYRNSLNETFSEISETASELCRIIKDDPHLDEKTKRAATEFPILLEQYKQGLYEVLDKVMKDDSITPQKGNKLMKSVKGAIHELERSLELLAGKMAAQLRENVEGELSRGKTYFYVSIFIIIFAMIAGQVIGWFLGERVANPIAEITSAAQKLEEGDINIDVKYESSDELGVMADAFREMIVGHKQMVEAADQIASGNLNVKVKIASERDILGKALEAMAANLRDIILQVKETSVRVGTGSQQITEASQTLASGATDQASSLEEISSSVSEVASKTRSDAENASQVNTLAKATRDEAGKGGHDIEAMVDAMREIGQSSEQISKIIKTIDDIAFQTNILALNAAVEAARAGRHGKGFAVVADEVRTLAGRSAKAAKETADLIDSARTKVANGQDVAGRTQESFKQIIDGIVKVSDLAAEIASSADEQARGVAQINAGLTQIDQVTQQNTANAEQTASAARELTSMASTLQDLMGRFIIDHDDSFAKESSRQTANMRKKVLGSGSSPFGSGFIPPSASPPSPSEPRKIPVEQKWGGTVAKRVVSNEDIISLEDQDFG